jgi:hypothetical protein
VVLLLAASPVGALPGLLLAFTIAFFVAPPILLLGLQETALAPIVWTALGLYAALTIFLAARGGSLWLGGDHQEARVVWFWTVSLVAFALSLKFSADALERAWP